MIYILAPSRREAMDWVRHYSDPPLSPREWGFVDDARVLRGLQNITIVHYDTRGALTPRMREVQREVYAIAAAYPNYGWIIKDARNQG